MSNRQTIACRRARKRLPALDDRTKSRETLTPDERALIARHLEDCRKCAREYQIFMLTRATHDAAAATEQIIADDAFFRALRARINRGPELPKLRPGEESWAAALLLTARQLIPAMAMLLLLIIGATYIWSAEVKPGTEQVALRPSAEVKPGTEQVALRPGERVLFGYMYEYPAPTRDDVLETLVAAEEKENGK